MIPTPYNFQLPHYASFLGAYFNFHLFLLARPVKERPGEAVEGNRGGEQGAEAGTIL